MKYTKAMIISLRMLRSAAFITSALFLGQMAASGQTIQSINVSPDPLVIGGNFSIAVTASANVTRATATFSFVPGEPHELEIPLTRQGLVWTGFGTVPADLDREHPGKVKANARIVVFESERKKTQSIVHFDVTAATISAIFDGGVLTITGDNGDNTLTAGRDAAGNILVNDGTIPIKGGVPTIINTSRIRILGLNGKDILLVDDNNGPMPEADLFGGDGGDTLTGSASNDLLDGGAGDDILNGGRDGIDRLLGGPGNDLLNGGRGNDELFGGDDDDQILWNPGDGSDLVEGENGQDTLIFNGANVAENIDLSANGPRLRFFRDVANITMDCDGVERVSFKALGGADQIVVNDLTGTNVTNVDIDLLAAGGVGDAAADNVIVNGTAANDVITVTGAVDGGSVTGLTAAVSIAGAEHNSDKLVINTLGGEDSIDATAVEATSVDLALNGGNDNDTLKGGKGNDFIDGGRGTDTAFGGAGNDTFQWDPGDGNDIFEGQADQDTLLFNGANIAENIAVSANGSRLSFTRDVANIVMDCNGVENVLFNAKGGADTITVNDLTGTDVRDVKLDLFGAPDAGDGAADTVIVKGTNGNDTIVVTGSAAGVVTTGLTANVTIVGSEAANDRLVIDAVDGDDAVTAAALPAGFIGFTADGGNDDDVLVGSGGNDTLLGGLGDDVLIGGPGLDVLDGGPGANILIQD